MSQVKYDRYPDGKRFACTFSYDDGCKQDRRLVELFNKYGMKCTFNLNSNNCANENSSGVKLNEIKSLYEGHEISVHTLRHLHLERMSIMDQLSEIMEDRKALEKAWGKFVRGMAFPFGTYNSDTLKAMDVCEIVYGRTTVATNSFVLPEDFRLWNPTSHHNEAQRCVNSMVWGAKNAPWRAGGVIYIWGHAYEFDNPESPVKWEEFENMLKQLKEVEYNMWFATNIEIYDYAQAIKRVRHSADGKILYNPSDVTLWISVDDEPVEFKPMTYLEV